MNRKALGVTGIVIAVAIGATGWWWHDNHHSEDGRLVLFGNVDVREVQLAFRQPGRLDKMLVDEGASVQAGQPIAQLDAKPYRDSLASAEAEVAAARAELDKLKRGNRPQEITQALEAVRQADAAFKNADDDERRQRQLATSGSASQRTADAARASRDQAQAALASARAALDLKRAGSRSEDVASGAARLADAEAGLERARTALEDTTLIAPSNGVVLARVREPGSMLGTGAAVYTVSLRDPLYVRAYATEPQLARVAQGASVRVRVDGTDKTYPGTVGFVSPQAEFTPKSVETRSLRTDLVYRLRIVVPQADAALKQGMPVTVDVDGDARVASRGQ